MAEKQEKQEEQLIYFKLGDKRAIWAIPDKSISLSRFTGDIHGKVSSKDSVAFRRVQNAIMDGILTDTKKDLSKTVQEKEALVDITNLADQKVKHTRDASEMLRKMKKDEIIEKIKTSKNPYLIAAMIEHESAGKNISKRRRDDVVNVLKKRLEELSKELNTQVLMTQYLENTDEGYELKPEGEVKGKSEKPEKNAEAAEQNF